MCTENNDREEFTSEDRRVNDTTHSALSRGSFAFVAVTLMIVVILVYGMLTWMVVFNKPQVTVPQTILNFLNMAVTENDLEGAVTTYVLTADVDYSPDTPGADMINFDLILRGYASDVAGYDIRLIQDGYMEFVLLNSTGSQIYPAVGFAYHLSADEQQIEAYNICRLQPFSQRDAEYVEYWS